MAGIEKVLSKITPENPLPEYSRLFESSSGRPVQYERAKEGNQLAVLAQHRLDRQLWPAAGGNGQVSRHLVADNGHALGWEETNRKAALASPPGAFTGRRHVDHRNHVSDLMEKLLR